MSIQIRLDIPALRSIIEQDPEFHLDLKSAVVAEIVRKSVLSQATSELRDEISRASAEASKTVLRELRDDQTVEQMVGGLIGRLHREASRRPMVQPGSQEMERLRPVAEALVAQSVSEALSARMVDVEHVAEERIAAAITRMEGRMERHIAALEQGWREEALRQVKADVLRALQPAVS